METQSSGSRSEKRQEGLKVENHCVLSDGLHNGVHLQVSMESTVSPGGPEPKGVSGDCFLLQ